MEKKQEDNSFKKKITFVNNTNKHINDLINEANDIKIRKDYYDFQDSTSNEEKNINKTNKSWFF